jgi:hypothetical protein
MMQSILLTIALSIITCFFVKEVGELIKDMKKHLQ